MKFLKYILFVVLLCLLLTACQKECAHEYHAQIEKAATCTEEGIEIMTCSLCQDQYTQPIPFLDHAYGQWEVEKTATCAEEGLMKSVCTGCGGTKYDTIDKLAHTLGESSVTKEPNCTQEGERTGVCTECGATGVIEKIATNNIHNFENTVIQEPTCTDPGKGINTCTLCQYSEECTYELKAHSYGSGEVTKKATCTAKGSQTYTCKVCQKTKIESIAAAGHKWTGATCQKAGTCSVCGAVGSKAKHDYEIVRETNPNPKYYAREVDKKCRTCGVEKTLYYVDDIEFDVEYIQSVLDDYAKSYGFVNIIHSVKDLTNQQKSNKFLEVFKFDWYKDPIGHFIEQGKLLIDTKYKNIKNSTFPMERRLLHLEVSYGASASVGCGMLNVYIGLTELPAE